MSLMCRKLGVGRSGFYAWRGRAPSARLLENERLSARIRDIHSESDGVYGSPKVLDKLREEGETVGLNRVARLMRRMGLAGCPRRRYRSTTRSDARQVPAPNRLARDFTASAPNERWAADTTCVHTGEGWLYLAVIVDLYAKVIVGWSVGAVNNRELVTGALRMALSCRKVRPGLLHHSDRGSPYASVAYRKLLSAHGIICSMSGAGQCYDNAVVESWFGLLKRERVRRRRYRTRREAADDLFDYIERFYNRWRPHSAAGRMSPLRYEGVYS